MTSLERLRCALRGGTPDRVPVSPFGWGHVDPDSDVGAEMLARLDLLIPVGAGGDPFFGAEPAVEHRREGRDQITIFHTPAGDLRQVHRHTAITSATVEFACRTPADLEQIAAMPHRPAGIALEQYAAWVERAGDEALVLVGVPDAICWPATLLSPEDFCLCWAEAPAAMRDLVALAQSRLVPWIGALCEAGVRAFRIIGGEYATTQLGPRGFEALCLEQDRELCRLMRRHDAIAYYHNHGPVMRYLDLFRAVEMHALDPLEGPPYGDCDLRAAKSALGDICLVGNLDDMEQIEQWPHDRLRALAAERLAAAGPAGFVLGGTASGTYTERGARGFLALLEVVA